MSSASRGSPRSGARVRGGDDGIGDVLREHADGRRRLERRRAREHAVERRPEAVDVGARIERLAAHLLGRHVIRRAEHLLARRDRRGLVGLAQLREPEVEHLDVLAAVAPEVNHEVLGLSDRGE